MNKVFVKKTLLMLLTLALTLSMFAIVPALAVNEGVIIDAPIIEGLAEEPEYVQTDIVLLNVDFNALEESISDAEALFENDWTAGSWTVLQARLAEAQALLPPATPTQSEIDIAVENLLAAIAALVCGGCEVNPCECAMLFILAEVQEFGQVVTAVIVDGGEINFFRAADLNLDITVRARKTWPGPVTPANAPFNPRLVFDGERQLDGDPFLLNDLTRLKNELGAVADGSLYTEGRYMVIPLVYGFNNTRGQVNGSSTMSYASTNLGGGTIPHNTGQPWPFDMTYIVTIEDEAAPIRNMSAIRRNASYQDRLDGGMIQPIVDGFQLVRNPVAGFTGQNYRMWTPESHRDGTSTAPKPLIVFHHGNGENFAFNAATGVHTEGSQLIAQEAATSWIEHSDEEIYVLLPQRGGTTPALIAAGSPGGGANDAQIRAGVDAFIQYLIDNGKVDENRVYISGLSAGGGITLSALFEFPYRYAAALVICPVGHVMGVFTNYPDETDHLVPPIPPLANRVPVIPGTTEGERTVVRHNQAENVYRWSHVPVWFIHSETDFLPFYTSALLHARMLNENPKADARLTVFPATNRDPGSRGGTHPVRTQNIDWPWLNRVHADSWSVFSSDGNLPQEGFYDQLGKPIAFYPDDHWNWIMAFNNLVIGPTYIISGGDTTGATPTNRVINLESAGIHGPRYDGRQDLWHPGHPDYDPDNPADPISFMGWMWGQRRTSPESMTIDGPREFSLRAGHTSDLTVSFVPEDTPNQSLMGWTSSNTAVVTVNAAGRVTAVSPGSATISTRSNHGGLTSFVTLTITSGADLNDVLADAENLNQSNFSLANWRLFVTAHHHAQSVYDNPYSTQGEIDNATNNLRNMVNRSN